MLVSTNAFLQSIKDNNKQTIDQTVNKAGVKSAAQDAKEALNKPNTAVLQQMQNKPATIKAAVTEILQNLAQNGTSKEVTLNTLKNSAVFANLGSVSNDLKSLMDMVKSDAKLAKFESVLSQFMKNIDSMDADSLMTQIKNSGVFLEGKLSNISNQSSLPKVVQQLLQNISNELAKIEPSVAKPIQQQITQILQSSNTQSSTSIQEALQKVVAQIKNVMQSQQSVQSTQLQSLVNQLQNVSKEGLLIESKLQNSLNVEPQLQGKVTAQIKTLLNSLQQTVQNMPQLQNAPMINKTIEHLLNQPVLFSANKVGINNATNLNSAMKDITTAVNNMINNASISLPVKTQLNSVMQTIQNSMSQLEQPITNQAQIESKLNLLTQLKTQTTQLQQIIQSQPQNTNLALLESKVSQLSNNLIPTKALEVLQQTVQQSLVQNSVNGYTQPKNTNTQQLLQQINSTLQQIQTPTLQNINSIQEQLQNIMQNVKNTPNLMSSNVTNMMEQLLMQVKPMAQEMLLQNSFTQNVTNLVSLLKNEIVQPQAQNMPQQLQPLMQKLEAMIQPNVMQQLLNDTNPANTKQLIQQDFKAVLMQLQDEIKNLDTPQAKEVQRQVDKLLGQIEYFQAYSYSSATQASFLPFSWDMMEEGELSFKKLKEDKFFVQINLKLKELGKVDMMVILHDKNQLDISIFAQRKLFKDMMQESMQQLKVAINQAGLIPANVRLLDMKEDEAVQTETKAFVQQEQIGMGISIKV